MIVWANKHDLKAAAEAASELSRQWARIALALRQVCGDSRSPRHIRPDMEDVATKLNEANERFWTLMGRR